MWRSAIPKQRTTSESIPKAAIRTANISIASSISCWILFHNGIEGSSHSRTWNRRVQLDRLIDQVGHDEVGGLLAVPVADTLKRSGPDGRIEATVPRERLWQAQTPQMFRYGLLREALGHSRGVTDESGALEALGHRPLLVAADASNLKVTYPADLALAEKIMLERKGP